ncbi:hypothetical protein [Micromonospora sp. NBC_01813]|uniref:hypothetical protein n=1 Tax=Micromonospora sp. NBC_01813 TaxID=2975988 RepID=UPI002DD820AA|nr:hypothetical protein [Micromonospora sp. NBC_01813]WSA09998.1 hypothetical protein OG958_04125 [Micromonospora sp. NBC_01813]
MAEKSADPTRAATRTESDAEGALAQPTVELRVLGDRSTGPVTDEPTVEHPIIRPAGTRAGATAAHPHLAEVPQPGPAAEPVTGLDDPTQEQPIIRPGPAAGMAAGPQPQAAAPAAPQPQAAAAPATPEPVVVAVTDEPDQFIGVVRRYGWVAAAAGVAAIALLCSAPFVSGTGLLWSPPAAPQTPAPQTVEPAATTVPPTPTPSATDTSPAATEALAGQPVPADPGVAQPPDEPAPTVATSDVPSPGASPPVATEPVLLGPDNDDDLRRLLDTYCKQTHGGQWMAWPGNWPGSSDGRWNCVRPWTDNSEDLDVRLACAQRYGEPVEAELTNRRNELSWRCFRP